MVCEGVRFLFTRSCEESLDEGVRLFHLTMGSHDGAEICKLVGLFILSRQGKTFKFGKENLDLYRDDGLAIIKRSARLAEKTKKNSTNFGQFGLKITGEAE